MGVALTNQFRPGPDVHGLLRKGTNEYKPATFTLL